MSPQPIHASSEHVNDTIKRSTDMLMTHHYALCTGYKAFYTANYSFHAACHPLAPQPNATGWLVWLVSCNTTVLRIDLFTSIAWSIPEIASWHKLMPVARTMTQASMYRGQGTYIYICTSTGTKRLDQVARTPHDAGFQRNHQSPSPMPVHHAGVTSPEPWLGP